MASDGQGREALAKIIYDADNGPKHSCDSESFEDTYQRPWLARADAVLDWLKTHDAEVAAGALREAADAADHDWLALKPEGWGSNDADRQTLVFAQAARDWLRVRADESNPQ